MSETIGEQGGETARLSIKLTFFDAEPFEVEPGELPDIIASLYSDGRAARSAGRGATWAACFQEARQLVATHRDALDPEQLDGLRQQLDQAGYYEEKELGDPYNLGPVVQQEAEAAPLPLLPS